MQQSAGIELAPNYVFTNYLLLYNRYEYLFEQYTLVYLSNAFLMQLGCI